MESGEVTIRKRVGLRPLSDKVVIRPDDPLRISAGGIHIPDQAKEKPLKGEVVAVGPGRMLEKSIQQKVVNHREDTVDWHEFPVIKPMVLKVGDKVLFPRYAGHPYELEDASYLIMTQDDVMAVIENAEVH